MCNLSPALGIASFLQQKCIIPPVLSWAMMPKYPFVAFEVTFFTVVSIT